MKSHHRTLVTLGAFLSLLQTTPGWAQSTLSDELIVTATRLSTPMTGTSVTVIEEEDIKVWDFAKKRAGDAAVQRRMKRRKSGGGGASDPAAIGHHSHTLQFRDVLKAIQQNRPPAVDGPEGRRSVEIILGIYKAAETGRTVHLPLKSDPVLRARKK